MSEDKTQAIVMWLIKAQPWFKQHQLKQLIEDRKAILASEDKLFYDQIEQDFQKTCKEAIKVEASSALGLSAEDIDSVLENLNIKEYLQC